MTTRRVVMLAPVLPCRTADNAGTRYVHEVSEVLLPHQDLWVVTPDGMSARRSLASGGVPPHMLLTHQPPTGRMARSFQKVRALVRPGLPAPVWKAALRSDPDVRRAISGADIVDLQWEEQGALIPRLRRLNARARIVCTVHDVLSQRYARAREAAASPARRARWGWAALTARWAEKRLMRQADTVLVFSDKDAALLPQGSAELVVVTPPLARGSFDRNQRPRGPELLLVSMLARWENEEGLLWFLDHVLPRVRHHVPDVRLRVAGLGIRPHVAEAAAAAGIELLGFVEDLEPLYEAAATVVVPLRLGAGLKFKVVDALVRGVPVVTTSVGAEGIGETDWFAGVHDDPAGFAEAVVAVLTDQGMAESRAAAAKGKVEALYGQTQFEETMRSIYGQR